jgi:hypothetical protein
MSETNQKPDAPAQTETKTSTGQDTLYSQAFIYAMCVLPIGAGIIIGAFKYLSPEVASTLAGTALTLVLGNPSQFFFGAAKHASATTPTAPITTTVTAPPATVTTTTGTQP